jgi:hypothetical protein
MIHLDFFNGKQYLPDLIGLSFTFLVLYIYARITEPRSLVDMMATPTLARLPKIILTNLLEIVELNPFGICHRNIIDR